MHRFLFCLSYNVLTYLNINTVARVLIVHRKFLGHTQVCPDRSYDQTALGSFQCPPPIIFPLEWLDQF